MQGLYHFEVGFPDWFDPNLQGQWDLTYGPHARREALLDRYGLITLPSVIDLAEWTVIEIEVGPHGVQKYVLRGPLDEERDLVLVVTKDGFVKTVWTNHTDDTHRTLDVRRYIDPRKAA